MGRYYQDVETHFLGNFAWCIARPIAPEQKLVQQIFFLQIVKQSVKQNILILVYFYFRKNCSKQALSVGLETGECE